MLKILVVEDEFYIKELICKKLQEAGYETVCSINGKEALEEFENKYFDLIITDIMMPIIDGNRFVKTVRQTNKDIPIIMLTALNMYSDKEKGFNSGADDYMVKPVNMKEMLLRVKVLLRRYKIVSENKLVHKSLKLEYSSQRIFLNKKEIELKDIRGY